MNTNSIDHVIQTEILIIGGGFAGCFAAIKCRQLGKDVVMVDKGYISRSCTAQFPSGNISVSFPEDDKDLQIRDTIERGEYLNDQEWVKIQMYETYDLALELDGWGRDCKETILGRNEKGELIRIQVHGDIYTYNCVIYGHALMDTLRKKVISEKITFFERTAMSDLITDGRRVGGAVGFNYRTGETYLFRAKAIILAAAGTSFKFDTRQLNNTGEGQAMAYAVGARLQNLEQGGEGKWSKNAMGRLTMGAVAPHCGMKFVNRLGEEFMKRLDPVIGDRAYRLLEIGIKKEIKEGRGPVYMDYTEIPPNYQEMLKRLHPESFVAYSIAGVEIFKGRHERNAGLWKEIALPNGTASQGGGVKIDTNCATNIPGLYAIGDNACAPHQGTHPYGGANFGFCLTSGNRAAKSAAEYVSSSDESRLPAKEIIDQGWEHIGHLTSFLTRQKGLGADEVTYNMQSCFVNIKVISQQGEYLRRAIYELEKVQQEQFPKLKAIDYHDLMKALGVRSMLVLAEGVLKSILCREESRGVLVRDDFPLTDNINWLKWVLVEKRDGGMHVFTEKILTPIIDPPRSKYKPKEGSDRTY
jgi:succinate dehydrogenase/fumarate reductase flavoprotein subunit